ncbi:unnamed protein product [Ectocarpus sp. 4 AP-2014]
MGGSLGPNVLITGTPGTGKTCTSQQIAERTGLRHINVGDLVRLKQCHEGRDESFDTFILDEDKLCDAMETQMEEGGNVVDFHSCDFFPEHWFDLILVLRAETSTLFDRLKARGYSEKKVGENVECEIMQVVLEEAKEGYPEEAVHEVPSNTIEELESNVSRVAQWLDAWRSNNAD